MQTLIYIFVVAWFLLLVLGSNIGKRKGYTGWPFAAVSFFGTIAVFLVAVKTDHLETVAPFLWLLPLLVAVVAFVLPKRA